MGIKRPSAEIQRGLKRNTFAKEIWVEIHVLCWLQNEPGHVMQELWLHGQLHGHFSSDMKDLQNSSPVAKQLLHWLSCTEVIV